VDEAEQFDVPQIALNCGPRPVTVKVYWTLGFSWFSWDWAIWKGVPERGKDERLYPLRLLGMMA
jgi:hypothetical protein